MKTKKTQVGEDEDENEDEDAGEDRKKKTERRTHIHKYKQIRILHLFQYYHGTHIFIIFVQQCFISTQLRKTNLGLQCFFLEIKKNHEQDYKKFI